MKILPELTPDLTEWALKQPLFFIATAPLTGRHVNVSPKGYPGDTLSILSPRQAAYLDQTGSGCETAAHLYENGRATLMFISHGRAPRILRLFCTGRVIERPESDREDGKGEGHAEGRKDENSEFAAWLKRMGKTHVSGVRAIYVLDVFSVTTSCGYAVPRVLPVEGGKKDETGSTKTEADPELAFFKQRSTLLDSNTSKEAVGKLRDYIKLNNTDSLDGLPGLRSARREAGEWLVVGDVKTMVKRVGAQKGGIVLGFVMGVLASVVLCLVGLVMVGREEGHWVREALVDFLHVN